MLNMNIDMATDLGFDEDGSSADRERYQDSTLLKEITKICSYCCTAQSINEDKHVSPTNMSHFTSSLSFYFKIVLNYQIYLITRILIY